MDVRVEVKNTDVEEYGSLGHHFGAALVTNTERTSETLYNEQLTTPVCFCFKQKTPRRVAEVWQKSSFSLICNAYKLSAIQSIA